MKEKFVELLFSGLRDKINLLYNSNVEEYLHELHFEEINNHIDAIHDLIKEVMIP